MKLMLQQLCLNSPNSHLMLFCDSAGSIAEGMESCLELEGILC